MVIKTSTNKLKLVSILVALTTVAVGCHGAAKEPELANDVVLQLKLDQSQLQTLQAQANPIIKDINDTQEVTKKKYPGYQINLNTLKLEPVTQEKK